MNFHDFLEEHAKFPFPSTGEGKNANITDISEVEAGLIDDVWRATHAVRDNNLFQKLCDGLRNILGNTDLTEDGRDYLLKCFLPRIETDERGQEDAEWYENPTESQSRKLLDKGVFTSTSKCLWEYRPSRFRTVTEPTVEGSRSAVHREIGARLVFPVRFDLR